MSDRQVDVVVQISGDDVLAGRLYHRQVRSAGSETFIYDPGFLADPRSYALDPRLPLVAGPLHTANGRAMFAAFSDCAPDRWGQRLLVRNEKHLAAGASRQRRTLRELDYLLGVSDDRMAFGVLIANTDDHLRNHGFLRRTTAGWSLSPAFDLNPDPEGTELSTGIDDGIYDLDIEAVWAVAPLFDLDPDDAADILRGVATAVVRWRDVAGTYGLDEEVGVMTAAFDAKRIERARSLAARA